ncbi:YggS family pyridoxal phosphate-dependent enzyme [Bacteroidales bacterium OttesenSCG-928-L03]|nr:YggS family pyridoxal phosphate-dependent enzyme [Bacteroidales bacterium OttesenSCG-928-L03]MDL2241473.1 YggS family pyridoxal phosphate-dependent enzyme [Bacteroidales bacterium OttesenSCG-928-L03]
MSIASRLNELKDKLPGTVRVVAVSKFHPVSAIREVYETGHRLFGESRVQELLPKYEELPRDIQWHFIGHLQTNKVKQILPFIDTIESVDSERLLREIDKEAGKIDRVVRVFLQVHIAQEEHKFGFSFREAEGLLTGGHLKSLSHVQVTGLMGMASLTDDTEQIRREFELLYAFYTKMKAAYSLSELSMGMSDDYPIAVEEGSTLVRIGSKIFGTRE